jgi:hypothetical protein
LKVTKSGRTTGLTGASISAVNLDVTVDYFLDCAETEPYLSKIFTNQLAISGNGFSDAGDSGSLIVDTGNAEPVGLYFAGGTDTSGVSQAVANHAPDVLNELNAQLGGERPVFPSGVEDGTLTAEPLQSRQHCVPHPRAGRTARFDPLNPGRAKGPKLD